MENEELDLTGANWLDDDVKQPNEPELSLEGATWLDDAKQPTATAPAVTMVDVLRRQAGLSGRALASAALSPISIGGNIANKAINGLGGNLQMPGDVIERGLDRVFPKPETGIERFTDSVARSAPAFAFPGTLGAQVGGNALISYGQSEPGEGGTQALIGGLAGAGGHALGKTITGLVRPSTAGQTLLDRGVTLSPGQAAGNGSAVKAIEELATSNPISAYPIRAMQRRGINEANIAAAQSVVKLVDDKIKLGAAPREALEATRDAISSIYDRGLAGTSVPAFVPEMLMTDAASNVGGKFPMLESAEVRKMMAFVNHRIGETAQQNHGMLTGEHLKQFDSEIGQYIRNLSSSTTAADKTAAPAWREFQNTLRETMSKHTNATPEQKALLKNANTAYRQLLTLEKSLLPGADNFTPRQLARQLDKAGVRGSGLNSVSDAMNKTLPNQIPNSGTAERLLGNALPGLLFGSGATAQQFGYDQVGAGLMAAGALGTRPGTKMLLGAYPIQKGVSAEMLATMLRNFPAAGTRMKEVEE